MNDVFPESLKSALRSFDLCVGNKEILPGLILLYSSIDYVSSLEHAKASRRTFIDWTSRYMLNKSRLPCNGTDLYAARCGVLHNFSTVSDLQREGKAREIIYAWGTGTAASLAEAVRLLNKEILTVHVDDLRNAFASGLDSYFAEVTTNSGRAAAVKRAIGRSLVNLDKELLEIILNQARENGLL